MRVAFLGKCGAGKSSLINGLFGLSFTTGRYQATTRKIQRAHVFLADPDGGEAWEIEVVDTPGFAESQQTDAAHLHMYTELLPTVDHLVWVVATHPRAFRPDQEALIALAPTVREPLAMTVALTRADTIGPNNWDHETERPSPQQLQSLAEQARNVLEKLVPYAPRLTLSDIVPCSSIQRYALDIITERIWSTAAILRTRGLDGWQGLPQRYLRLGTIGPGER